MAAAFVPLSWPNQLPATQYQEADGTLVTHIGGRVRGRHAREAGTNNSGGVYAEFGAHYFERRTHEITIYDDAAPGSPADRVLTIVVRPQWFWHAVNFRHGFVGVDLSNPAQPERLALYADNGGVKMLPGGTVVRTPLSNYDQLPSPPSDNFAVNLLSGPGSDYAFVKQITVVANTPERRRLREGDVVEFELGIFLARLGVELGRGAYYSDAIAYQVGSLGAQPWFRAAHNAMRPWDARPMPDHARLGGGLTVHEDTSAEPRRMLLQAGTNIAGYNMQPWMEGRRLFNTSFATGAHSDAANPVFSAHAGRTGPVFSQTRCSDCHVGNGKSSPVLNMPMTTAAMLVGERDAAGNLLPHRDFGTRLQQGRLAVAGQPPRSGAEGALRVSGYRAVTGRYPDGTVYSLQTPEYMFVDAANQAQPLPPFVSVRMAPHLAGMGLLEAVPESTLQTLTDPGDRNGDGVRGRLSIVRDARDPGIFRVGRFGWRADVATVEQQVAAALNFDLGVTTALFPALDCGRSRSACATSAPLGAADIDRLVRYIALLGVPAPRHFDNGQLDRPEAELAKARVRDGAQLFSQANCSGCHVAELRTGPTHRFAELRNQTIRPYTNLLLHDMGPDLADVAGGNREWRTAPLWGIGLLDQIDPNVRYLHDGRARTLEEAILWHGGEAERSRQRFLALRADDRRKLIEFLRSL